MFKKLKIAQLAPPWIEVPPKKYGGTELIVSYLSEELTKKGHDVTLFASGDSKTKSKLSYVFPKALYEIKKSWNDDFSSILHSLNCFNSSEKFDVIHNHFNYYGIAFSKLTQTPTVTTYHGNFNEVIEKKEAKYDLLKFCKNHPFISISNSQRPKKIKLNFLGTVYNGIDATQFKFNNNPDNYLAWLGRITPKKGILDAIKIAKKSKLNLKIAAKIDKNHLPDVEFYNKKVKPLIDGEKISFIGEIGGYKEKSDFLGNALALLNPIEWDEPFGLNMTEAMVCGTPVIAYNRGSVREIVENNKNGFIVKNVEESVKAIKKIDIIKRSYCRNTVEKKFTKEIMVNNYEKLYYELINNKNVKKQNN